MMSLYSDNVIFSVIYVENMYFMGRLSDIGYIRVIGVCACFLFVD